MTYTELATEVGALVDVKNKAYGNSFDVSGAFLRLLYPAGIKPEQYDDALAMVRIFDKQKRIATDKDALGESPYKDIVGYGLLGLRRSQEDKTGVKPIPLTDTTTTEPLGEALNITMLTERKKT